MQGLYMCCACVWVSENSMGELRVEAAYWLTKCNLENSIEVFFSSLNQEDSFTGHVQVFSGWSFDTRVPELFSDHVHPRCSVSSLIMPSPPHPVAFTMLAKQG